MVGEAVADVAQTALLDVLLDGVEGLLLGDLHLGVRPAGHLDDHVEDAIVLVGEEGDVVEGGDDLAILLDEHAVLCARGVDVSVSESVQAQPAQRGRVEMVCTAGNVSAMVLYDDGRRSGKDGTQRLTKSVGCADEAGGVFCADYGELCGGDGGEDTHGPWRWTRRRARISGL